MSDAGPVRAARRILIVDDADEARSILAIALGTIRDASVQVAESAEGALHLSTLEPMDVLVTDVRMSGMNGFELLEALRMRGRWPVCGALVISGETDPELRRRAAESGAAAFFSKPFSPGSPSNRNIFAGVFLWRGVDLQSVYGSARLRVLSSRVSNKSCNN